MRGNLGRPMFVCDELNDINCAAPRVEWFYETKPSLMPGTYTVEGTSRTFTLSNNNQKGRLAMVAHPGGTTFYEYDAMGRITAQMQYEIPGDPVWGIDLPLNASKMKVTEMTYTSTGAIDAIRYPSGRRVDHLYGNDKSRPTEILIYTGTDGTTGLNQIAKDIIYNHQGQPESWQWGGSTGVRHEISRDLAGRITKIEDVYNSTVKTSVLYSDIDGDGDVAMLTDQGPAAGILDRTSLPQNVYFSYDNRLEQLKRSLSTTDVNLSSSTALRTSEVVGAQTCVHWTHTWCQAAYSPAWLVVLAASVV